jgi:hypothetical protein
MLCSFNFSLSLSLSVHVSHDETMLTSVKQARTVPFVRASWRSWRCILLHSFVTSPPSEGSTSAVQGSHSPSPTRRALASHKVLALTGSLAAADGVAFLQLLQRDVEVMFRLRWKGGRHSLGPLKSYPQSLWKSRDSVVGILTGYWLDDRRFGVGVPVGSRIFTPSCRPDRLWFPPNLLSNGYWGLFPRG